MSQPSENVPFGHVRTAESALKENHWVLHNISMKINTLEYIIIHFLSYSLLKEHIESYCYEKPSHRGSDQN